MDIKSTTVLAVRRDGKLAMAADGQVTLGQQMIKQKARKVRRLYQDQVIVGFAGAAADAFALLDKFEGYLEQYSGNLMRAAVALAQQWRIDRALRRLEALLIAANEERMLLLSGTGDIIEPDEDILAIGSGGSLPMLQPKRFTRTQNCLQRQLPAKPWKLQVPFASTPMTKSPWKNCRKSDGS